MALNYSYGILGTFLVPQSPNFKKKGKQSAYEGTLNFPVKGGILQQFFSDGLL